jgi:hypothetical protein
VLDCDGDHLLVVNERGIGAVGAGFVDEALGEKVGEPEMGAEVE